MSGTYGSKWQQQVLGFQLGQNVYTSQTYWVALCTSYPFTAAGSAISSAECGTNLGGYARYPIGTNSLFNTVSSSTLAASSGAVATNTATMTISAGTTSNWGDVNWIAVMDTSTYQAGNILAWCTCAATRTILTGDQVLIAAGSLTIQLGP